MSKDNELHSGADWQTSRKTLAQLLFTLDGMQDFTYGMQSGGSMIAGTQISFNGDMDSLDEAEQLRVMADLSQDGLIEIDMLCADLAADAVSPRARWSVVEARQHLTCIRALATEAREAMLFQSLKEIPAGVLIEFADSLRRIKLLLLGAEETARAEAAA